MLEAVLVNLYPVKEIISQLVFSNSVIWNWYKWTGNGSFSTTTINWPLSFSTIVFYVSSVALGLDVSKSSVTARTAMSDWVDNITLTSMGITTNDTKYYSALGY